MTMWKSLKPKHRNKIQPVFYANDENVGKQSQNEFKDVPIKNP